MSLLLSVKNLSHSFGAKVLFKHLNFSISKAERVGLIGPNGAGKSSLLKIISGQLSADDGEVVMQKGLRIGFLEQIPTFKKDATIESCLLEARSHPEDWEFLGRAQEYLSKLGIEEHQKITLESPIQKLSGGWKKRVAFVREILREPDLMLLDEPTNHLDIESILWLEELLQASSFATLTITHDRYFLQRVSNRILELDAQNTNGILSVQGNYEKYLQVKEQLISAAERQESTLRNTLRRESEWLSRGPKARSTKQQARIQRAEVLKNQVEELEQKNSKSQVQINFQGQARSPKKLIEAKNISKSFDSHLLFHNLNLLLSPGSRLGLIGPNGCGKSSLLKILSNQENADEGEVFRSEQLALAYFEQNRDLLHPQDTLLRTLCPSGDHVQYRGESIHIRGYLDRFLFRSEQMEMKVAQLSGGEQSRLLIAKLMLQEANVLILDEPTNDLDLPTLHILQDCLIDFPGAVLLVTHDRFFLSQVATQLLAFNPQKNGETVFFASLEQWEDWYEIEKRKIQNFRKEKIQNENKNKNPPIKKIKLSYKDQREFDLMEGKIQKLEEELEQLNAELEKEEHKSQAQKLLEISQAMNHTQSLLDQAYHRWAELEKLMTAS